MIGTAPVPVQVAAAEAMRYSVNLLPLPAVQYVTVAVGAPTTGQLFGNANWISVGPFVTTPHALCNSRRILSSARRAFVCAWNRLLSRVSALEPDAKMVAKPVTTIVSTTSTTMSSTRE